MDKKINSKYITIFEGKKIRRLWDEKKEKWYFSVIDIIAVLTHQVDYKKAKSYWTTLKNRLKNEGSEVVTNCDQLKMLAQDGKMRETDVADVETLLRLIQSVPSPKAEPIKLWLVKKGGRIAKNAKKQLESKTGKKVVSRGNFLGMNKSKNVKKLKKKK